MTEKMKWYFLIAVALIVGALIGYFATNGFSSKGQAKSVLTNNTNTYLVKGSERDLFVKDLLDISDKCYNYNPFMDDLKKNASLIELDFKTKEEFELAKNNLYFISAYCDLRSKSDHILGESNLEIDNTIFGSDNGSSPCAGVDNPPACCCDGKKTWCCVKWMLSFDYWFGPK